MVLKHKSQNVPLKIAGTLVCVLFISSANPGFQPNQAKPSQPPLRAELCAVLRSSEFYDGKQITVKATYRKGPNSSQLYCIACIDRGDVWMREVLPRHGEGSEGIRELNDLLNERKSGLTVNGVFTGTFRGPGVYGFLGASTYQIEVREVRDMEVLYNSGADPEDLPKEIQKKACQ